MLIIHELSHKILLTNRRRELKIPEEKFFHIQKSRTYTVAYIVYTKCYYYVRFVLQTMESFRNQMNLTNSSYYTRNLATAQDLS